MRIKSEKLLQCLRSDFIVKFPFKDFLKYFKKKVCGGYKQFGNHDGYKKDEKAKP